jgi:hypothetical protein
VPRPSRSTVLVIDDNPADVSALIALLSRNATAILRHPQDVTSKDLRLADLVLVDYRLDNWTERDRLRALSLKPLNGVALAAILRSRTDTALDAPPKGFAIHSGHLSDLSGGLPPQTREHLIARGRNLEWAFPKSTTTERIPIFSQVLILARAIRELPDRWPSRPSSARRTAQSLLHLRERLTWRASAWEDIEACHPPLHEMSQRSHGLAFIRWLLHQILPYPCFLIDSQRLALRLRVTPASLTRALERQRFRRLLRESEYQGVLTGFLGPRWWRSGVEATLWKLTDGNHLDPEAIFRSLRRNAAGLEQTSVREPVIALDESYRPVADFQELSSSVRIQPDDWPSYAEPAWTSAGIARDSAALRGIVITADRDKLSRS